MANPRVPYAFSDDVPAPHPPPEGRILAHLVINVEHWRFDEPMPRTIITPPHGRETVPDVPNFGWADYGMRAGLPRMLEAIRDRGLPASTSCNAGVVDAYPRAAEAMLEAQWEFIGHGLHQKSLNHAGGELEVINASLDKLERFTGRRPKGWLSPGLRESLETPELLRSAGIDYVCDWVIDDVPRWMRTDRGPLMAMPYNLELNDSIIFAVEKHSSAEFLLRLEATLARFERECERAPRVLALGLHPHLMGVPHRIGYFERMLDLLMKSPNVAFMTGSGIADWYRQACPPPVFAPGSPPDSPADARTGEAR